MELIRPLSLGGLDRSRLFKNPLFLVGLALRVMLVCIVVPASYQGWFVPFFQNAFGASLDPWSSHLAAFGTPMAFPYGIAMFVPLLAPVEIGNWISLWTGLSGAPFLGFGFTILAFDFMLLCILHEILPDHPRRLLVFYWLSPITIYICYWHGQLDVIPVVFLMLSLLMIERRQPGLAGLMIAVAVSAKFSMVLALPFLLIYIYANKRLRGFLKPYLQALVGALLVLETPILLSPAARLMVFGTPEVAKVYEVAIGLGHGIDIFVLPVAYTLILFGAWSVRRMSFDLLIALIGSGFFIIVLLTTGSPGWFLWVIPFLVLHLMTANNRMAIVTTVFAIIFVGFHVLVSSGALVPLLGIDLSAPLAQTIYFPLQWQSIWLSVLVALGVILCLRLVGEGILRNDYFRLSRQSLVIGIGGDSGSGKDTLALSLANLFGRESVVHLSGDDYHRWDRHKPMWQVMTHLNPQANDLQQYRQDALALASGHSVQSRHYDHATGRMTKPRTVVGNDVVLLSGLHVLFDREICERCDVRVFLDMDESLRRFLKLQRDVSVRGHSAERVLTTLGARQFDRERYILPQAGNADVVFTLLPLHPALIDEQSIGRGVPRLKLRASLRSGSPYEDLVRVLVGVCGLHVDVVTENLAGVVEITVEGDMDPEDVSMAAREVVAHLDELLTLRPVWQGGAGGIMELFVLGEVAHALRKRLS